MTKAIREHARSFIAIIALIVLGLAVTFAILSQQRASFPEWLPFLGGDRYELKAEFTSAQAVTPGQGQSVNIAGIRVGNITDVQVEQGNAVVTMEIENEYGPLIHDDATLLLRPRTGLQDMTIELNVGSEDAPQMAEGSVVPNSQTAPNVNPDEVLASLDADTQAFLRLLLADGAKALGTRGRVFGALLKRFEPTARDLAKFQGAIASRRKNLEHVITNFGALTEELGRKDTQLNRFVDSSNAVLGSFANQEAAIRESLREFPSALTETQETLRSSEALARVVKPAATDLIPAAQALAPALRQVQPLFRNTVGPIENQIRPFVQQVREPIRSLNTTAKGLASATPDLKGAFGDLNILFNSIAYNPPGAQQEGNIFWLAWLNHNANATATLQDANGPLLRGVVMITCGNTRLSEQVASQRPFLRLLYDGTLVPLASEICPAGSLPFKSEEPRGRGGFRRTRMNRTRRSTGRGWSDPSPEETPEPTAPDGV